MKILRSECGAKLSSRWLSFWAMKTAQLASTVFLALVVLAIFAPIAQAQTTSTLLTAGAIPTAEGDDDGDGVANINDIDSNLFDPDADSSVSSFGGYVLNIPVGEDDPCYSWWEAKAETAATFGVVTGDLCVSDPIVIPRLPFGTDDSDSDDSDDSDTDDSDSDDSDDSETGAEATGNGSGNDDTNNAAPPVVEVTPVVILPEPDPAPVSVPGPLPAPTEPIDPETVADFDTSDDTPTIEAPVVDDETVIEVPVVEEPIVEESLEVEEGNESQESAERSSLPEEFEAAASPGPQFVVEGSHPSFSAPGIPNIEKIVDEIFGETERELPQVPQLSASNAREPFFPSLGASIPKDPKEVDESGLPLRAVAAAAAIMLLMGSSAGAVAASSGRAVRWGLPGFVLTIVYRLAGAYRERRCQECGCALRYSGGDWVEKDSYMSHGIYDHVHSPSKLF